MTLVQLPGSTRADAASSEVGKTLGVEEEFHVVDPETLDILDDPALSTSALAGRFGARVHPEIATTQVETATRVCRTLDEVRRELIAARGEATAAAASVGAAVLAASTHPFASWEQQRLTARPRYLALYEKWGVLALQQVICGCHVHVGVPDLETAVRVMEHARPYLPVVLALTGSSPFHEGVDTGYESYRTQWYARWPITGATEPIADAAAYVRVVEGLRVAGCIDDSSNLYWDVRPSAKYPTLEFRIGDVCTSLDDAVLHAGLLRSLTRVLAARVEANVPAPQVRPELLRAARWRAARYGVSDELFDSVRIERLPARAAVDRLLQELREDLEDRAEWHEIRDLAAQVIQRGTSATRQRRVLHRTGDPLAVARMLLDTTVPAAGLSPAATSDDQRPAPVLRQVRGACGCDPARTC